MNVGTRLAGDEKHKDCFDRLRKTGEEAIHPSERKEIITKLRMDVMKLSIAASKALPSSSSSSSSASIANLTPLQAALKEWTPPPDKHGISPSVIKHIMTAAVSQARTTYRYSINNSKRKINKGESNDTNKNIDDDENVEKSRKRKSKE